MGSARASQEHKLRLLPHHHHDEHTGHTLTYQSHTARIVLGRNIPRIFEYIDMQAINVQLILDYGTEQQVYEWHKPECPRPM